ncbi:MAG: ADP-glyceromanno-heptose 6-epimerase [Candidatus Omnitrophota bacterium]
MIIITGAAGFIGSAVCWGLNKRGRRSIVAVDEANLPEDKKKNLKPLQIAEYIDKDKFIKQIKSDSLQFAAEAIIHLGACSDTTETDEKFLTENNFEYTKALCEYCVKNNTRFIYASSAATYGDGSQGYCDDENTIDALKPLNFYAASKQKFDLWARDNKLLGRIAGLKYFNVFGPNEYHKADMRSIVLKGYEQIKTTGKMHLFKSYKQGFADGEQRRDFLYIKDAVSMTLFFLDDPGTCGIFNLGTGTATTYHNITKAIFKALNKPPAIEYIEMPETLQPRYQYFTQADISKLRGAGYDKPVTPIEEAIREYVQDYLVSGARLSNAL